MSFELGLEDRSQTDPVRVIDVQRSGVLEARVRVQVVRGYGTLESIRGNRAEEPAARHA